MEQLLCLCFVVYMLCYVHMPALKQKGKSMISRSASPIILHTNDHCAACGQQITGVYYTMIDRDDRYCATCIATRPRCSSCGAPIGPDHWQLHDGRRQCARCHSVAVYDAAVAHTLYDETVAALRQQFGMELNIGTLFRLVDAPTLAGLCMQTSNKWAMENHMPILGLYHRQGHIRVIYMLYGLPRLLFRLTVAHEYAHAWQGENCPLLHNETLREGFAEWVAYHHLLWLGCTKAARRMLDAPHPYRPALEHMLELQQHLGMGGVIEFIKQAE